ncbi:MAG TPA: hypothetical protein VNX00_11825, partial [Herbaspirillum sp.]|nr:hypothetical protein [Herbaspirillum sp.]
VAAKNKDMGMLAAVVPLVLETIEKSSSVSESFLEAMERSWRKNINRPKDPDEVRVILSFHVGNILTKLCEKGYVKPFQLAELFGCKGVAQRAGLSFAMNNGWSKQVSTLGNVLLNAAGKGVLPSKQLFKLLQADHRGDSALVLALRNQDAATVTAFGGIVLSAYSMGFLDSKQVAELVAHKEDHPRRRAFGNDVIEAYGQILQDIDAIKVHTMR